MKSTVKLTFALSLLMTAFSYANDSENAKEPQTENLTMMQQVASCKDCKGEELVNCFKECLIKLAITEKQLEEFKLSAEDTYEQMVEKNKEKLDALKAKIAESNTES